MQNDVLFFFEQGDFTKAEAELQQILLGGKNPRALAGLRACSFWKKRLEQLGNWSEGCDAGDFFYNQWFRFLDLYKQVLEEDGPDLLVALKGWLFNQVIQSCETKISQFRDSDSAEYLKLGRCYKFTGRYEEALPMVEQALKFNRDSAEIMAELADCYGLIGEMEISKALFREAFYLNPQEIRLDLIESRYMVLLSEKILKETQYRGAPLLEWLPVFAVVYGIFDVRREMRQVELGQLKQSIYSLKSELKEGAKDWQSLPRLLYRYFWLIDYYQSRGTPQEKIQQILLDIQLLDREIHRLYVS